jgi:hypothetical protein
MSARRAAVLLLSLGWAGTTAAQPAGYQAAAGAILEAALASDHAYQRLADLSDRIGPRLAGSPGDAQAVAWALRELERDGLAARAEEVPVPHWERGVESCELIEPVPQRLVISALGGSVATVAAGLVAEVVSVASLEELERLGAGAQGKIVLFNRAIWRDSRGMAGYAAVAPLRGRGAAAAARHGAVAMLIRSLGTSSLRTPHTGGQRYESGVPPIPAAALAAEDADLIQRFLERGERVRVRLRIDCQTLPDAVSANVIGDLAGRERPEELVLIGAHLDSWDLGTGALDDGAGVVIVMEAARLLRQLGLVPRRTLRVVLFANEENGLRGAQRFAEVHGKELPNYVATIESDSGADAPYGFSIGAPERFAELVDGLIEPLRELGAGELQRGGSGGADTGLLFRAGVPALLLLQDTSRYFDYHHSAADTFDKVDPWALRLNVAALTVMAYGLAELPELSAARAAAAKTAEAAGR